MKGFRNWRWHLDDMYVKLKGEMVYLWRAVDHEGGHCQSKNCWRPSRLIASGDEQGR
jgi:hypothetical protein